MPAGKIYLSAPRRKRTRRRRTQYGVARLPRHVKAPLPERLHTKMIYSTRLAINPGAAGQCSGNAYRANGLFDPDAVLGGHQPRGFDQIMQMYDHFIGLSCKINYKASNDTVVTMLCGITIRDTGTLEVDPIEYMESSYTKSRLLLANDDNVVNINHSCNVGKFLGGRNPITDPQLKGNVSSDPTEQAYFHVWACATDASDPGAFDGWVTLTYDVVFVEPKQPISS